MRRLAERGWGHVFFHGGVPAEQRGALIQRFHDEADCRLFLSTDAGSAGLNLQHAAAVIVNMDQPWNPALLEQRIGRVHRMGQQRGVQVIHLVAEESIEQGMLSLLSFKRALFDGVLDGGDSSVFMEGSRLSRFMDTVNKATEGVVPSRDSPVGADVATAQPEPEPELEPAMPAETISDLAEPVPEWIGDDAPGPTDVNPDPAPAAPASTDPWAPLLQAGLQWLEGMVAAQTAGEAQAASPTAPGVRTDPGTGERYLRLPLPEPATLRALADRLSDVLRAR